MGSTLNHVHSKPVVLLLLIQRLMILPLRLAQVGYQYPISIKVNRQVSLINYKLVNIPIISFSQISNTPESKQKILSVSPIETICFKVKGQSSFCCIDLVKVSTIILVKVSHVYQYSVGTCNCSKSK